MDKQWLQGSIPHTPPHLSRCISPRIPLLLSSVRSVVIISQSEAAIVERLGRYHRVLKPGLSFLVPFVDSLRAFTWRATYINSAGQVVDETQTSSKVDLRESLFNFTRFEVYSKDTVLLEVQCFMLYR